MDFITALGRRVNTLLSGRGSSQAELARAIGRSQPFISQFLAGKRGIAVELLGDIARFLDCRVADLFPDPGEQARITPSPDEEALVTHYRAAHPKVRQAIAAILELPAESATPMSPDSFRVAAAYERADTKDRGIVDAALGIDQALARLQAPSRGVTHAEADDASMATRAPAGGR